MTTWLHKDLIFRFHHYFHSFAYVLSILIPEFNTDVRHLVTQLWSQANALAVPYEIIVLDDASDIYWQELNRTITQYENCFFLINQTNSGRSAIRNKLAQSANYNRLIFLDADVGIPTSNFLQNYLNVLSEFTNKVIYGGCIYDPDNPVDDDLLLHWLYGLKIENPELDKRLKDPYNTFHTVNFAVDKRILVQYPFDERIQAYGFEDHAWALLLKEKGIDLTHIDNPVVHRGIYPAKQFLRNTVSAVRNVIKIHKSNSYFFQTKLTRLADYLFRFQLHRLYFYAYKKMEKKLIQNLMSQKPNLLFLQAFKLGIYLRFWNKI